MDAKTHNNLLVRTATAAVFVVLVLTAMLLGRMTYTVLLGCITVGCTLELWRLATGRLPKWLGTLYIILCMAAMWFFPLIGGGMTSAPPEVWDVRIAPAFIITVWANDTFAYLAGITLGRRGKHKLCERLSPKKTWEGFAGGIAGAMVVAAVTGRFWMEGNVLLWTAFGLVVALAAVGGDLAESAVKRRAGVKDSGTLLPGHGGVLDRFDATLGAVPVAFLFFLITWLAR